MELETQTDHTEWDVKSPEELDGIPPDDGPEPGDDGPEPGDDGMGDPKPPAAKEKDDRDKLLDLLIEQNRKLEQDVRTLKDGAQAKTPEASDPLEATLDSMGLKAEDRELFSVFGSALIERMQREFLPKTYEPLLGQMSVSMADWNALQQHGATDLAPAQQQKAQQFIADRRSKGTSMSAEELAEWAVQHAKAAPSPTAEARKAKMAASHKAGPPSHRSVTTGGAPEVTDEQLEQMDFAQKKAYYEALYAQKSAG
jgi:hypothetical protein